MYNFSHKLVLKQYFNCGKNHNFKCTYIHFWCIKNNQPFYSAQHWLAWDTRVMLRARVSGIGGRPGTVVSAQWWRGLRWGLDGGRRGSCGQSHLQPSLLRVWAVLSVSWDSGARAMASPGSLASEVWAVRRWHSSRDCGSRRPLVTYPHSHTASLAFDWPHVSHRRVLIP